MRLTSYRGQSSVRVTRIIFFAPAISAKFDTGWPVLSLPISTISVPISLPFGELLPHPFIKIVDLLGDLTGVLILGENVNRPGFRLRGFFRR